MIEESVLGSSGQASRFAMRHRFLQKAHAYPQLGRLVDAAVHHVERDVERWIGLRKDASVGHGLADALDASKIS